MLFQIYYDNIMCESCTKSRAAPPTSSHRHHSISWWYSSHFANEGEREGRELEREGDVVEGCSSRSITTPIVLLRCKTSPSRYYTRQKHLPLFTPTCWDSPPFLSGKLNFRGCQLWFETHSRMVIFERIYRGEE